MITAGPDDPQPPAGSKHVPSVVPGHGPRDASGDVQRQRDKDAGPTVPPGGYPQTVGGNPQAPAQTQQSDDTDGW